MDELPDWEHGTAAVLCASGPHAIPVSTAVRLADRRIAFALGRSRDTLARVREDPSVALCVFAPGLCFTAYGRADVVREEMESSPHVAAIEMRVETVQDHLEGARTEITDSVSWRWTEDDAADADAAVRAELTRL